jgi:hypothetical protein
VENLVEKRPHQWRAPNEIGAFQRFALSWCAPFRSASAAGARVARAPQCNGGRSTPVARPDVTRQTVMRTVISIRRE